MALGFLKRKNRSRTTRRGNAYSLVGYLLFYCTLAIGMTISIAWGYRTLRSHPTFAIDKLEMTGASSKTETDLREQLTWIMGMNFFTCDLSQVRQTVQDHPWVASVSVHGHLPRRIKLTIVERTPAGLVRTGKEILVVSDDGQTIAPIETLNAAFSNPTHADSLLDHPIMIGVPNGEERLAVIRKGLSTLADIRNTSLLFWGHIETLDLSNEQNMIIQLREVRAPLYLGEQVIPDNIRNYLAIAQHVQKEYPLLEYIELGFPNHIAIKPKEDN